MGFATEPVMPQARVLEREEARGREGAGAPGASSASRAPPVDGGREGLLGDIAGAGGIDRSVG